MVRYELLEFVRKLILIGVLTAVLETSEAYLFVALAVSFLAALVFATIKPFVHPRLDRCPMRLALVLAVSPRLARMDRDFRIWLLACPARFRLWDVLVTQS